MENEPQTIAMNLVKPALKFQIILMIKNVYLVGKDINQTIMEIV